jgi:transcriptional regulator with XRE-family HTH domain
MKIGGLMGDRKRLKEIIDEKGTNVRKIAKASGISAITLYSIIQKDSNIRFDFALRLANELEIDVNKICSASPFSGEISENEIYPTLPDGLNGALDGSRVKTYLKNSLYPLMYLFGKNSMPDVDNLLTSFYQLDDEARKGIQRKGGLSHMSLIDLIAVMSFGLTCFGLGYTFGKDINKPQK